MKLVFEVYEASDPNGTPLGELTDATDKFVRVQYNGDGEGRFVINRHSSQAAWFEPDAPPTYIKAYIDDLSGDPIFGFLPDNGGDTILAAEEEGAEEYTRSGLGGLSYLADAVLYHKNYTTNDAAIPKGDGLWHWANRPVGAILVRQLEEAKARGCFPFLTWDFSRTLDSNSDAWTDSPAKYKLPIGMGLRDQVSKAQSVGIVVRMDADLVLHAYDDHPGADVSGSVILQAAVNLRDAVERQVQASAAISRVLVQGETDAGKLKFRSVGDSAVLAAIGRRREGFVQYTATPTNSTLDRAGHKAIDATKSQYDGPTSVPVLIRAGEVPFTDYQPGDMVGIVLPGLAGAIRVAAIALVETETGEVDPVLDLGEETFDSFEVLADGVKPGGTGGPGTGGADPPPGFTGECDDGDMVDDFNRANGAPGTSSAGFVWTTAGGSAVIDTNRLRVIALGGNTDLDFVELPMPAGVTFEWESDGTPVPNPAFGLDNAYVYLQVGTDEIDVFYVDNYAARVTVPYTFSPGTVYKFRLALSATTIRLKVWELADPEPSAWNAALNDPTGAATNHSTEFHLLGSGNDWLINNLTLFDEGCDSPAPGQFVEDFTFIGDGVTTAFLTEFAYVGGSIVPFVNGLDWSAQVTDTDPETGAYDVAYPYPPAATVRATYQAGP